MTVSVQSFNERYPEFKDVPESLLQLVLSDAQSEVSQKVWRKLYERGVCALAGHMLYLRGWPHSNGFVDGTPERVVSSQSASGLSQSFATPSGDTLGNFEGSIYGQEYIRLKRLSWRHVLVTGRSSTVRLSHNDRLAEHFT